MFAFSSLSVEVDFGSWRPLPTLIIFVLGAAAAIALFASAWQVLMAEWLFVYHEPPRLVDLLDDVGGRSEAQEEQHVRAVLAASYAVAYEQYLKGNAISARRRVR